MTVRADAGFFSYDMIAALGARNACYSITIPQNAKVKAAIAAIDDDWASIAYTRGGEAQVAETTIAGRRGDKLHGGRPAGRARLIVRRTRLLGAQAELWPNWRYHCFVTHDLDTKAADTYHRAHATVELAIRDLKESAGLSRCPSGRFPANGAWLACCVLAHNLARWTARLGRAHPTRQLTVAATIATGSCVVNHSGRTAPAAQLAMAEHLRPATNPQPTPAHEPAPRARRSAAQPHPTNPPQPRTPVHAPKRASPHTRTRPAPTNPTPTPESPLSPVGGFRLRLLLGWLRCRSWPNLWLEVRLPSSMLL